MKSNRWGNDFKPLTEQEVSLTVSTGAVKRMNVGRDEIVDWDLIVIAGALLSLIILVIGAIWRIFG